MFFSIIVPIYNVEKYLHECVDSVLSQTFHDFEIILVDDGSPDACPDICDEYKQKDSRIKVIHKENGGLSDARNAGLELAKGEYIIFIDSDDYWDDNKALEKIYNIIAERSPDVITWRFKKLFEDSGKIVPYGYSISKEKEEVFSEWIKSRNLTVSAAWKAIKRELFFKNQLTFVKGVYAEDVEWCARLLLVSNTMVPSNLDFYIYRQHLGSITHKIGEKNIRDLREHINAIEKMAATAKEEKKENLMCFLAEEFCNFIIVMTRYKEYKTQIKWIKQKAYLLKRASSKKSKLLKLMIKCIGVRLSIKLVDLIR